MGSTGYFLLLKDRLCLLKVLKFLGLYHPLFKSGLSKIQGRTGAKHDNVLNYVKTSSLAITKVSQSVLQTIYLYLGHNNQET